MTDVVLNHLIKPFAAALSDEATTEVVVNRPGEFSMERSGEWTTYEAPELTFERLDAIGILAASRTGQDVSPSHPLCASRLPGGERIQICRPPATDPAVISLTIRRPPAFKPTLAHLRSTGMFDGEEEANEKHLDLAQFEASPDIAVKLERAVRNKMNVLIAGPTGSGKTTLARSLIDLIPSGERLITIEDTPEWNIPHSNAVALYYSKGNQGQAKVQSEDLVEAGLRMRPDRLLMQELRDGAAYAYLRDAAGGHRGCITTLHARSAKGAFDALRLMIRQNPAGATMPDGEVKDMLSMLVDLVVYCERDAPRNKYRVVDIFEREA